MTKTLFDKVWANHVVASDKDCPDVVYIDLHLIHEVTSPQAFAGLRDRGLRVRQPSKTVATMDHSIPTLPKQLAVYDAQAEAQLDTLVRNCSEHGIELHRPGSATQGIVHVIGPELGLTQPGRTIVCGDSHTATHGAFGALAFGIGTSEVEHVLACQCLLLHKPKSMEVRLEGQLGPGVTAKDIILALIAKIGTGGGTGYVIEYRGDAVASLDMEARMTICNMSIEAGARAGMIAPDDVTYDYLKGRARAPQGQDWDEKVREWRTLPTDDGAAFDYSVTLDVSNLEPVITYGTAPSMGISISQAAPDPSEIADPFEKEAVAKALRYMDLEPGKPLLGHKVDVVFIGSCTNSRLSDLRSAATVFSGRKVHAGTRVLVVPGSAEVKRQAEAEGLDKIFTDAGAEWREPGCSMCIAMNGDELSPGQYAVSTSNRNFEGRQGKGGRTFLASPLTAAAAAVTGKITDARSLS